MKKKKKQNQEVEHSGIEKRTESAETKERSRDTTEMKANREIGVAERGNKGKNITSREKVTEKGEMGGKKKSNIPGTKTRKRTEAICNANRVRRFQQRRRTRRGAEATENYKRKGGKLARTRKDDQKRGNSPIKRRLRASRRKCQEIRIQTKKYY